MAVLLSDIHWGVVVVLVMNIFLWMVIYYAHQESKRLGVTEYTDKAFYEPIINLTVIASVCSLIWVLARIL